MCISTQCDVWNICFSYLCENIVKPFSVFLDILLIYTYLYWTDFYDIEHIDFLVLQAGIQLS